MTLPELLVVVALIAALGAWAAPQWQATLDDVRAWAWQRELIDALERARRRSLTLGEAVTLCGGTREAGCDPERWEEGWIVFRRSAEAADGSGRLPEAAVLETGRGVGSRHSVVAGYWVRDGITFDPGEPTVLAGTWTLCREGAAEAAVVISSLGRPRRADGTAEACP